jgi:Mg2+/Co2+ transporter CorC
VADTGPYGRRLNQILVTLTAPDLHHRIDVVDEFGAVVTVVQFGDVVAIEN